MTAEVVALEDQVDSEDEIIMSKKQIIKSIGLETWVKYLLIFLLISFPFGSHLLSIRIGGYLTIYPFLILLFVLTFIGLRKLKLIQSKMDKVFLGFLLVWLVSAAIRVFYVEGVADAIIDVRSIGLMLLTSFVLLWTKAFIGFEEWRTILATALKNVFFLLTIFSLFELMTGIHFTGAFTDKISQLPISGYTYSPVFLFDNPNNLVAYFLLIGTLILLLDVKSLRKPFMTFFIVLVCFVISHVSMSRIGEATTIFLFAYYLVMYIPGLLKKIKKGLLY